MRGEPMDISEWLRDLGLHQYEATFRDNEIDDEVLPKLTAEDLKDIGVAIVGHRRKLLSAIAELPLFPPSLPRRRRRRNRRALRRPPSAAT